MSIFEKAVSDVFSDIAFFIVLFTVIWCVYLWKKHKDEYETVKSEEWASSLKKNIDGINSTIDSESVNKLLDDANKEYRNGS